MTRPTVCLLLAVHCTGLAAGCTGVVQLEPDPLGDLVRLEVTPKASDLVIADLSQPPAPLPFHAIGVFSDGARRDVTQQLLWNVDNALPGGFPEPGVFVASNQAAGHVEVIASADGVWATSEITVRIDTTVVDTAFPPSDPTLFDGAKPVMSGDAMRSPSLIYPNSGTWFPQGLPNLVFQLARGASNDAFRLTFDTELLHLVVLTGADRWETGPVLERVLAQSNLGDQVTVSIEAAAAADPGTLYQGPSIGLHFTRDTPDGPVYFWSAATSGIMRGAIGASSTGKLYPGDATCVGCHTIARDGSALAMGYGGEGVAALQTIDPATLATTISANKLYPMGWATYSPDGSLLLIANDGDLVLRDALTGAPINSPTGKVALPVGHFATHPEWSPDGRYVAIAYTSQQPTNLDVKSASIARLAFDPAQRTFSGPENPRAGDRRRQLLLSQVLARRPVPGLRPRDLGVARRAGRGARARGCRRRHPDGTREREPPGGELVHGGHRVPDADLGAVPGRLRVARVRVRPAVRRGAPDRRPPANLDLGRRPRPCRAWHRSIGGGVLVAVSGSDGDEQQPDLGALGESSRMTGAWLVAVVQALLFGDAKAPDCTKRPDPIECLVEARFANDAKAEALAVKLYRATGDLAALGVDEQMNGGYRGAIHLVPELPVGRYRKHLVWVVAATHAIDGFFAQLLDGKQPAYRWHDLAFRFVRSIGKRTPSAYASIIQVGGPSQVWAIEYNVAGSLLTSETGVRETLFHELFHINDENHHDWSQHTLASDYAAIVKKCGTRMKCLAPYAPNDTRVRATGTYYAFQPNNGNTVHEYAAELAVRYFKEQSEMLARGKLAGRPFKCGPAENGRAWRALADEFFAGVDHVPAC